MRHPRDLAFTLGLTAWLLAGCATDNNTLIFGTSTNIGLDVSAAPNQGGAPQLTLGYKRAEGVWMPLRVVPAPAANGGKDNPGADTLYQSSIPGPNGETQKDSYSVFASIGAKFGGSGKTDGADANGGLAQFFATGAAAVAVTQNQALVTALKVSDPASSAEQAKAVTAAASGLDSAIAKLSPEAQQAIKNAASAQAASETVVLSRLIGCVGLDQNKWANTVDKARAAAQSPLSDRNVEQLKKLDTPQKRIDWLSDSASLTAALDAACKPA